MEQPEHTQCSPLQQAVQLREAGQYAEALHMIERYIQTGPVGVEALALRGQLLILLNALPQAMAAIEQALTLAPDHPALLRNLARGQLRQGQIAAALTHAQAAFQASQGGLEDAAVLASALGANGRPDQALGLIDQVLQHAPDYAEARATRAMLRLQAGDAPGAYADAGAALQRKPFMAALWPVFARLALQLGDKAQARQALQHCLSLEPDNLDYLVNLGELHRDAGAHDEAIALLSRASERAPGHPAILRNLGVALQEAGRFAEAETCYRAALAAQPDNADVRRFLASLLRQNYRYQEACQLFAQLAAEQPNDAMAHTNYGVLQNDCKQYTGAAASLRTALTLDPTLAEAHGALANALRELGQLADARQAAECAVTLKPQQASLRHTLANLLKESGDIASAVAHYQQALALDPTNYPGLGSAVTLAILAYLQGEHARALLLLQQAATLADKRDGPFGPSRVYWIYLNALLDFYRQFTPPDVQPDGWLGKR